MTQTRFNATRFNAGRFNGGPLAAVYSSDLVVFDDFSLHNGSTRIVHSLQDSGPTRELLGGSVPRGDGMYLNADYWRKKLIDVQGTLTETSEAALETAMDTMRKNLRSAEAFLDITRNGVVRRYTASLVNMDTLFPERQHFNITHIPFRCRFECRTPFAVDRSFSSTSEQVTSSPLSITGANNVDTIEAEPVIVVIVDAANTVTVLNIKRIDTDGNTLDEIEYNGTVSAGDVFEFNTENKQVKKNGSEVNYTGSFPVLDIGQNIFKVTTTGTSLDMYYTIKWKNRYL